MPEQVLTIMRFALLAAVYLFFLRVLRVTIAEMSIGVPHVSSASAKSTAPKQSTVGAKPQGIRCLAPSAFAGSYTPFAKVTTVGRDIDNTIHFDDGFLSGRHAKITEINGTYVVEDLGSTNGSKHNGNPLIAPTGLRVGDHISCGSLELEIV